MDSDQANHVAEEATVTIHQINALYQDIETILNNDWANCNKLGAKNREIGRLTAEWI